MKGFRWAFLVALWAALAAVAGRDHLIRRSALHATADAPAALVTGHAAPGAAADDPAALVADRVLCRSGTSGTKDCPVPLNIANIPTAIPAANIGAGTVDNTEFALLNGLLSPILTTSNVATVTNKSIDAGQLTGSILDARLSANVALLNTAQTFNARKTFPAAGANAALIPAILGGGTNTNGHTVPNIADDTFALLAASQSFSNKTYVAAILSGSVTGTYTLAGTPTLGASFTMTDNTYNFGDPTHRLVQLGAISILSGAVSLNLTSNVADGASAVGLKLYNAAALANATSKIFSWGSNSVEKGFALGTGGLAAPTIGPNATQQHTLPAVTSGTVLIDTAAQSPTNKTFNSATNTISLTATTLSGTLPNANLPNVGPGAGANANVNGVTLDAQGRVLTVSKTTNAIAAIVPFSIPGSFSPSTTYFAKGHGATAQVGGSDFVFIPFCHAATVKNLSVWPGIGSGSGTLTIRYYNGSIYSDSTITISAGTSLAYKDITHSQDVNDGDAIAIKFVTAGAITGGDMVGSFEVVPR